MNPDRWKGDQIDEFKFIPAGDEYE